jgi:hypothetical protein
MKPTLQQVLKVFVDKGYPVYLQNRPNIFGVRKDNTITDAWDDYIGIFWGNQEIDNFLIFEGTTDPGKFYANNPIDGKRTAYMVPGFYEDVYEIGLHQGKKDHECLKQSAPIAFYQDADKDLEIDIDMIIKWQSIGANIHGTRPDLEAWRVGKFSAACQVIKLWNNFQTFMNVCRAWKERFSYGLL